jgi:Flp pilus assembly protein TadG
MLVVPFTFLLIGIIEIGLMFTARAMLESGTYEATRQLRTGDFQEMATISDAETAFQDILCNNIDAMMDCTNIQYEVLAPGNITAAASNTASFQGDGCQLTNDETFNMAGPEDTVLVRAVYCYELKTPFFKDIFGNQGSNGDQRRFVSTRVIETEPYEF